MALEGTFETFSAAGSPANCTGVIAVAGLRHAGSKVGFSDLGPAISIAAPAGNCVNTAAGLPCLYPMLTATAALSGAIMLIIGMATAIVSVTQLAKHIANDAQRRTLPRSTRSH